MMVLSAKGWWGDSLISDSEFGKADDAKRCVLLGHPPEMHVSFHCKGNTPLKIFWREIVMLRAFKKVEHVPFKCSQVPYYCKI